MPRRWGVSCSACSGGKTTRSVGSVSGLLELDGVRNRPVRVAAGADWTLLLTSGPFGDKLPVGFRGCHASVGSLESAVREAGECDLRVVAALPNRLAAQVLRDEGAGVRLFAPSTRNMKDGEVPGRKVRRVGRHPLLQPPGVGKP